MKILYIRDININIKQNGSTFVELFVVAHHYIDGVRSGVDNNFGSVTQENMEFTPCPIGDMADDGVISPDELIAMIGRAAVLWISTHYKATIDEYGRMILED